ncbi:MAG: hypothetical protein E7L31_17335, partial [Aeromonas sp.]|nr:hypothetical protein [Aeromonas sp.]
WCQAGGIRQGATVDQGMIVSLFPVNAIWVNSYEQSTPQKENPSRARYQIFAPGPHPSSRILTFFLFSTL